MRAAPLVTKLLTKPRGLIGYFDCFLKLKGAEPGFSVFRIRDVVSCVLN